VALQPAVAVERALELGREQAQEREPVRALAQEQQLSSAEELLVVVQFLHTRVTLECGLSTINMHRID
jgi:hypothetical protein